MNVECFTVITFDLAILIEELKCILCAAETLHGPPSARLAIWGSPDNGRLSKKSFFTRQIEWAAAEQIEIGERESSLAERVTDRSPAVRGDDVALFDSVLTCNQTEQRHHRSLVRPRPPGRPGHRS